MAIKKKAYKKNLHRNILISTMALVLVVGLILSAVLGFADFLAGDERTGPTSPGGEDYPSVLEGLAVSLNETLATSPDNVEIKMQLASVYLELAMVHGSLGAVDYRDKYVQKGEELLQQITVEIPEYVTLILKLAVLAAFYQEDNVRAEKYFRKAVDLDKNNVEAHLYYGIFLALGERYAESRIYMEKVLELEPEETSMAEMASAYLEKYKNRE